MPLFSDKKYPTSPTLWIWHRTNSQCLQIDVTVTYVTYRETHTCKSIINKPKAVFFLPFLRIANNKNLCTLIVSCHEAENSAVFQIELSKLRASYEQWTWSCGKNTATGLCRNWEKVHKSMPCWIPLAGSHKKWGAYFICDEHARIFIQYLQSKINIQ